MLPDALRDFIQESEPLTEQQLYKLSESLFDEKKLLMISDLTLEQQNMILKLVLLNEIYLKYFNPSSKLLDNVIKSYLKIRISNLRLGRKELIEMFKRIEEKHKEETLLKKKGLFR